MVGVAARHRQHRSVTGHAGDLLTVHEAQAHCNAPHGRRSSSRPSVSVGHDGSVLPAAAGRGPPATGPLHLPSP